MTATALQVRSIVPTLTVNDLQRSLKLYRDGLGFHVGEEMKDGDKLMGVMLQAGEHTLGLAQDDFKKGRDRVKGIGMRLYLETSQDLGELAKHVKSAGFTTGEGPAPLPWGPTGFTVTDPDGFKMTFTNPE